MTAILLQTASSNCKIFVNNLLTIGDSLLQTDSWYGSRKYIPPWLGMNRAIVSIVQPSSTSFPPQPFYIRWNSWKPANLFSDPSKDWCCSSPRSRTIWVRGKKLLTSVSANAIWLSPKHPAGWLWLHSLLDRCRKDFLDRMQDWCKDRSPPLMLQVGIAWLQSQFWPISDC